MDGLHYTYVCRGWKLEPNSIDVNVDQKLNLGSRKFDQNSNIVLFWTSVKLKSRSADPSSDLYWCNEAQNCHMLLSQTRPCLRGDVGTVGTRITNSFQMTKVYVSVIQSTGHNFFAQTFGIRTISESTDSVVNNCLLRVIKTLGSLLFLWDCLISRRQRHIYLAIELILTPVAAFTSCWSLRQKIRADEPSGFVIFLSFERRMTQEHRMLPCE